MNKRVLFIGLCSGALLYGAIFSTSCNRSSRTNETTKQTSQQQAAELLIPAPAGAGPNRDLVAEVSSSRIVAVNLDTVRQLPKTSAAAERAASSISFQLKDDLAVTGMVQQFEQNAAGSAIWTGTVGSSPDSFFVLVERDGNIAAHVSAPEGEFYVLPTDQSNVYRVDQVQTATDTGARCKVKMADKAGRRAGIAAEASPTALRDDGKRIDILVVYTAEAEKYYGTADKLKVAVDLAEKETNLAMQKSQLDLQVKVVNIVKVSFKETLSDADGTSDSDLDRLAKGADGKEARDLRDANHADQVTLLRAQGDMEGIAFLLEAPLQPESDQKEAFSALRVDNVVYKYNFTHELGHNLGCNHNAPKTGLYRFSRGYCFDLDLWNHNVLLRGESKNPSLLQSGD